jgi:hypothetical protein
MAIRESDWKLVRYDPAVDGGKGGATPAKLYNLTTDIQESNDLIDANPDKAKSLQAAWDKWNQSNVPPLWGKGRGRNRQDRDRKEGAAARRAVETIDAGR